MKWGLIVRAEKNRGLGVMGRDMDANLKPDKTAVVVIADYSFPGQEQVVKHQHDQPLDGLEHATVLRWPHPAHPLYQFDEREFRSWAAGLDVVVMLETPYDARCLEWLDDMGIQSVLYVMPEMYPHDKARNEAWKKQPDVHWYPTSWFPDTGEITFPVGRVMYLPVTPQPFVDLPDVGGPVHLIHVGGKEALGDRNGSRTLPAAVRTTRNTNRANRLTIYSQTTHLPLRQGALTTTWLKGPDDKERMYADAHALVMPRRYGGLCLPVLEALSYGLAVVMTDTSPNNDGHWPIGLIPCERGQRHRMPCGDVQTYDCDQMALAGQISALCGRSGVLQQLMVESRKWAVANSWEARRPAFLEAIHEAASDR